MIDWYRIRTEEEHAEAVYRQAIADADNKLLMAGHKYCHDFESAPRSADAAMRIVYACDRDARVAAMNALHRARQEARS